MARGRWLKKVGNRIKDRVDNVQDLVEGEGTMMEKLTSKLGDLDLGPTVESIKNRGMTCGQVARETVELCQNTREKSDQMVAFGSEIQSTLQNTFEGGMDASSLETIKELTDGQKLQDAMKLAEGLDEIAIGCVDKSVQMIDIMEDAMDDLPDVMEKIIDRAADQQDTEEDESALRDLKTLDDDVADVKACIAAIQDFNIATAFEIGLKAFEQLAGKAQRSRAMFSSIQGFSTTVEEITDFSNLNMKSLASKIKDILRCIRLSEVMRAFAEATKKIVQVIIDLFRATADKISTLWAALAFAKDCMTDCVAHVLEAKTLCLDAHTKSRSLLEKSDSVLHQLKEIGQIDRKTVGAVRSLTQGDEIPTAIELARNMDDMIIGTVGKVGDMIDRVSEGFQNLPDIITEGFDMENEGNYESDPQPEGVEADIEELVKSREAFESADIFTACKTGASGFSSVSKKTEMCTSMITNVTSFATNCDKSIESFLGVWDLGSIVDKIKEMCRMVSLGELMKKFAAQIKELLFAIVALMKSFRDRILNFDIKELGMDTINDAKEKLGDRVDDLLGDDVGGKIGDAMGKVSGRLGDKFKGGKLGGKLGGLFK